MYLSKTVQAPMEGHQATSTQIAIRIADIIVSIVALVILSPLLLFLAAAVFISDPGPILFAHRRIGMGGIYFRCFKFRTMVVNAEARLAELLEIDPEARAEWMMNHKLRNDPRVTPLGRFLRKSSLDELPQFANVLIGTMSVVGPRPIVTSEIARYGRYFAAYCSVKPGITGLWQVSGRNDTSYCRRVALDLLYLRRRSLTFNLRIMLLTIPAVFLASGSC